MSFGTVFDWLAAVVPLAAIAAGLAFWFGWQYTNERGRYLGVEVSVMELTPNDVVLRSADALIIPATVSSVVVLVWLAIHGALLYLIRAGKVHRWIRAGAWVAVVVGFVGLVVSVVFLFNRWPFEIDYRAPPLVLGFSAGLVAEGASLIRNVGFAPPPRLTSWQRGGYIMLASLVVISLFWVFSLWAGSLGRGRAEAIEAAQERLTLVVVYSDRPLGLQAPVVETVSADPGTVYRYKYTGLRFLQHAADKYFLWPFEWDHVTGGTIVLPEGPGIRLEYTPGKRDDDE
ncbi:hypothetical protein J7E25_05885 [Agromyces sp. ISL-38]|uniref:hypothetical protein n=1 Tax=Agromyces sp. ISL-38 TaxID=2819107 RepID=UPI001BE82FC9|nr:hypothetical protein [Agromyces sp. ISL-38]MBT2498619.1 hypothetical protein [Agromyces sp. ISL-38]MBT2518865.1 hypothetical protein [Streptomyces sp. ISL-90]